MVDNTNDLNLASYVLDVHRRGPGSEKAQVRRRNVIDVHTNIEQEQRKGAGEEKECKYVWKTIVGTQLQAIILRTSRSMLQFSLCSFPFSILMAWLLCKLQKLNTVCMISRSRFQDPDFKIPISRSRFQDPKSYDLYDF